ncbi:MAG: TIGR03899 family protein [Colwellia sp.]|nr:TIGR03899 family protein [Colwellia sp.]
MVIEQPNNGQPNNKKHESNLPIENEELKSKNVESPTHKQFFKITQQFGLEAPLLPIEKQMPIEDRSTKRGRLTYLRQQENIEAIMDKTFAFCANKSLDKRPDLDWFDRYITLAENVSNKTMQDLWAKILMGELTRPGSYSLKALKVFRDMSIVDAKLLAKACSLAVKDQSKKNIRLISGTYQQPGLLNFFNKNRQQHINLSHFGLNYADILSLADNHLVYKQESELNVIAVGEKLNFYFNGLPLKLSGKKSNIAIQFYKFTPIGTELANLISDKPNDDFFTTLKQQLRHHFEISE